MTGPRRHADAIPLRGGHVALDFANTAGWHASEAPSEWLADYGELARWVGHVGLVPADDVAALHDAAIAAPDAAARSLGRVVALRETLYRVCRAFIGHRDADPADLMALDAALAESAAHTRIVPSADGFALGWAPDSVASLDAPYWRLARAAADLLTSPDLPRLRQCESAPCGWLFLDRSRNTSRRWCASEECGNRERVRRHLARR